MADTLGSVGVILSSLFIEYFGWYRSDPICSMVIAVLIFLSVIPLLKDSILVLLQRVPKEKEGSFFDALDEIMKIEHVMNVYDPHLWQYSSSVIVATVRVYVNARANEQRIISQSKDILHEHGFSECSVQVDKELFRKAIRSYGPSLLDSAEKYNLGVYTQNDNILRIN
jgi:zinc transporter 5/7